MKFIFYIFLLGITLCGTIPLLIWFLLEGLWSWDWKKAKNKCDNYLEALLDLIWEL